MVAEDLDQAGDVRFFLPDGHVEALYAGSLLVDDRVDADGGLAGLAVADDQLALAAADGRHGVDGLDAGLQRLLHRLPLGHAGGGRFDGAALGGDDRPPPSSGLPSGSITRPSTASPTGTHSSRPVLRTSSPSLIAR